LVTGLQGSLGAGSAFAVLYNAYGATGPLTLATVAAGSSSIFVLKSARSVDREAVQAPAATAVPAK